jgi:CheY-like chemotaxis protein
MFCTAADTSTSGDPRVARTNAAERARQAEYWKKVHAERDQERHKEQQQEQQQRIEALKAARDLVHEGAAIQSELIQAEDGPPPVVKPSIFKGKRDFILVPGLCVLLVVLGRIVLVRHRREAEIRALTGDYLTDGIEAAMMQMPELFAPAPALLPSSEPEEDEEADEVPATRDPREDFFAAFPDYLREMRKAIQEAGRANDPAEKQKIFSDLTELIAAFKVEASLWQLRPIWQVTCTLELLLQRLAEKSKDATPSVLRTVASALDLLADLAVPNVSPDLLIMPPLEILAVDDDPLCRRALVYALQKANLTPDIAEDGQQAVALAVKKPYDVVFMDIQMPEMDGLTACTKIHETNMNANTPVVFVTVQSDFHTRAQSNVIGGSDLIAKPFLIFELTVKAITFAARKRLKPAASLRPQLLLPPKPQTTGPTKLPAATPAPQIDANKNADSKPTLTAAK